MTDDHDLEHLRQSLLDDEEQRHRLLAGLGHQLDLRNASDAPGSGEVVTDDQLAELIDSGKLLYSPPAVAERMVLAAQLGASESETTIVLLIGAN